MWKTLMRARAVAAEFFLALAFAIGGALWAYFALRRVTGTPLILHFDDLHGITAVGGLGALVFTGIAGVAVVVLNGAVALSLRNRDQFLAKFLAALTLAFAVLLFIAFAAIINANI